jgi:hypothetical protein
MSGEATLIRVVLDRLDDLEEKIDKTLDRVGAMERWRAYILGGWAVLVAIGGVAWGILK